MCWLTYRILRGREEFSKVPSKEPFLEAPLTGEQGESHCSPEELSSVELEPPPGAPHWHHLFLWAGATDKGAMKWKVSTTQYSEWLAHGNRGPKKKSMFELNEHRLWNKSGALTPTYKVCGTDTCSTPKSHGLISTTGITATSLVCSAGEPINWHGIGRATKDLEHRKQSSALYRLQPTSAAKWMSKSTNTLGVFCLNQVSGFLRASVLTRTRHHTLSTLDWTTGLTALPLFITNPQLKRKLEWKSSKNTPNHSSIL